jgi:murein DD-endopeptidase MepM/ murein hydrolase activator NlpD
VDRNGFWTDPVPNPTYRGWYHIHWKPSWSTFGKDVRRGNPHQGVDLVAATGTTINAVMKGKVVACGERGNMGKYITLEFEMDGKKYYAQYWHLSQMNVSLGQKVEEGQAIGATGRTGNASTLDPWEDHLHFGVSIVQRPGFGVDNYVKPENFMYIRPASRIIF